MTKLLAPIIHLPLIISSAVLYRPPTSLYESIQSSSAHPIIATENLHTLYFKWDQLVIPFQLPPVYFMQHQYSLLLPLRVVSQSSQQPLDLVVGHPQPLLDILVTLNWLRHHRAQDRRYAL